MHPLVDKRIFLGEHTLFEKLSSADMTQLTHITKELKIPSNHCLIRQGEAGEQMYIIVSGKLNVYIHIADDEDVKIGELSEGDAFGEISLFDEESRTATVTSSVSCNLLVIRREPFRQYLLAHPLVALQLLTVMTKRLRSTSDLLKDTLYEDVASRLGDALKKIASAYGRHTRNGLVIDMSFDDAELGHIAGLPKDIVCAQLRHWKNRGLLKYKQGSLILLKPEEMGAFA